MSLTNANMDLSDVQPDDFDQLSKRLEEYYRADNAVKSGLAYHWERNHMFLDGKQWIVYDATADKGGSWKPLQVSKPNEYIPRPVTNYIFDEYQTLKSYLIQNKPRSTVTPNTQLYRDKQAAQLASLVCEANWKRLCEDKNYEYAASCGITYGTVFKKSYWDTSTLTMAKVPRVEMQPVTDPLTGQVTGQVEKEVVDPQTGEVQFDEIPLGDVNTAVVEPYRIALDPMAVDIHNCRWIMEYCIQPLDWINEVYGRQEPGYTGRVDEVKPEASLSSSMQRFVQLKNSSGVRVAGNGMSQGTDEVMENTAVVKEYYEAPSRTYPHGRLVVVANGIVLYSGDSPYSGPDMGDWHPYSEFRWEVVPGRFWGRSPLDDTTEIQKHINSIDAAVILVRKTQAIPQKLIPQSAGIKKGEWTGRPGQEVYYRDSGGPAPSTIPAAGVDAQVFKEREQKVSDIKTISGGIDILKGDRPAGVTAASALEMLFEVGTGKLRPALDRWKVFVETDQKKQLRWTSKFYREPRPEFIRLLHSKNKEIPEETINAFIGADLYDNCNVTIEAGSNIPKLKSAEKALLLQLAQLGSLNLESPENRMEFNKRMGVIGFDNDVGPDTKRAEWENDLMDNLAINAQGNKPVLLVDDDHQVHKDIHNRRMKEPSFLSLPQDVQQAYMQHVEQHEQMLQQQQMQAMQQAALTGKPPAPPQNGTMPTRLASRGKGVDPQTQHQAITPDIPKLSTS